MKAYLILFLFFSQHVYSIECKWWQTKVRAHIVSEHERENSTISKHPRQEHCREKWRDADNLIPNFNNDPIKGWPNKEFFKHWKQGEIQIILEILSTFPKWAEAEKYKFFRSTNSIYQANPATSEITYGSIVLYDQFFKEKNKSTILIHEYGHHLFKKLSKSEINEFAYLAGWIESAPPKNLIKPDSALNKEEDFTNHLESYYENLKQYKQNHPKLFEFFQKRYPL